jgi:hypothetical protein
MPDRRRVSLAPVNTVAPAGISSVMRARAVAASGRISTVNQCALRAAAARSRLCAGAGSVNGAVEHAMVKVSLTLVVAVRSAGSRRNHTAVSASPARNGRPWMSPRAVSTRAAGMRRAASMRTGRGRALRPAKA